MKTQNTRYRSTAYVWLLIALGMLGVMMTRSGMAGLVGPYPVDGNTLHLWHLQDPGPTFAYDSVSNQNPQITGSMTLSNTPGINAFTPGSDHFFSYMQSAGPSDIYTNVLGTNYGNYNYSITTTTSSCFYAPWYQVPAQPYSYPVITNIANFCNTNTGAFTFEAIVNPSVSLTGGAGPTPNIMSGDNFNNEPNIGRGWLWRIKNGAGAGSAQFEFNDIGLPNGPHGDLLCSLPATGNDAPLVGNWYHIAIAYTGSAPTNGDPANVVTFYWTLFNGANTYAHALTNFQNAFMWTNGSPVGMLGWTSATGLCTGLYPSNSLFGTPMFVLGGDGRGNISNNVANANGWNGSIAEVRLSSCYRHSNEMIFNNSVFPAPPTIVAPTNTLVGYGQTLIVPATALGSTPMSFQWYQVANGVTNVLAGQTNQTLTISNVTYAANGGYGLLATNSYGDTNSVANNGLAMVTVGATFQELFNTGCDANNNPLDQTAPGSYDLHYLLTTDPDPNGVIPNAVVWGDQGPVGGTFTANGSSVWIGPEENAGAGSGSYTFNTTFQIDETSLSSIPPGGVLTGTLWANGPGSETIPFYVNGVLTNMTLPANAETTPLGFQIAANLLQPGSNTLQIVVTNGAASPFAFRLQLNSLGYALTAAPAINNQPNNDVVNYGNTAAFSVVALGAPPLSYQWYSNGVAIAGATARTLSFTATNFANSELVNGQFNANYEVAVSNFQGSVTSSVAQLTIDAGLNVISAGQPIWGQTTNIVVIYSSAVDLTTATTTGNYSVSGGSGATVLSASVVASNEVVLTTSYLTPGTGYTLNVQGVYNNVGFGMSPTSLPVGIYPAATAVWIKADTGISTDGNNAVNQWNDLSGNANNFSQIPGTQFEPQLVTNSYLGKPVVRFTGTNETYMYASDSPSVAITGDMSIFAVVGFATLTGNTNGMIVSKSLSNIPAPYDYYANSGADVFFRGNGTVNASVNSAKLPSVGVPHLMDVVMQGTSVTHRLDANTNGTGTLVTTIANASDSPTEHFLYIGTREDAHNRLSGDMAELIVIGSALSTNDVASMENYLITKYHMPTGTNSYPTFIQAPPSGVNVSEGGSLTLPATIGGTGPLSYQWFDVINGTNVATGSTSGTNLNATLTVPSVPGAWNGDQLELIVSNSYGTATAFVSLNVGVGAPQIITDLPPALTGETFGTVTMSVVAIGAPTLTYQWQFNGTNLNNDSRISGAQSSTLVISDAQYADAGSYQVIVSNGSSTPSSIATLTIIGAQPVGFNAGTGWTAAHSGVAGVPTISSNLLTLTDGNLSEASSFFFNFPQYIGGFAASFTYQAGGNKQADGITFCLQNDTNGPNVVGAGGGDLAVNGIVPSWELEFNIYSGSPEHLGYGITTNGGLSMNTQPGPINLASGDPIGVSMYYAQGHLSLMFTDSVALTSFTTNINVGSIPTIVGGSTAYVGFTGSDGGESAIQTISNFTFVSIPPETIQLIGTNSLISWPSLATGYLLQENSNLVSGNWINVTNPTAVVNGTNLVNTPMSGDSMFYRLILQP